MDDDKNGKPEPTRQIPLAVQVCRQVVTTLERMLEQGRGVGEEQLTELLQKARRVVEISGKSTTPPTPEEERPGGWEPESPREIVWPEPRPDDAGSGKLSVRPSSRNIIVATLLALIAGAAYLLLGTGGPTASTLGVRVTPPSALVVVDGRPMQGATAVVQPGKHVLEARAEGYRPHREEVEVLRGEDKNLSIQLDPLAGPVIFSFEPDDAIVKLDGKIVGENSPVRVDNLDPGVPHAFTIEHLHFVKAERTVTLAPHERREEKIVLEEREFSVEVDSKPAGASIQLDGAPFGETPATIPGLKASRTYKLTLEHPDFGPREITVFHEGKPTRKLTIDLAARPEAEPDEEPGGRIRPAHP